MIETIRGRIKRVLHPNIKPQSRNDSKNKKFHLSSRSHKTLMNVSGESQFIYKYFRVFIYKYESLEISLLRLTLPPIKPYQY